MLGSPFPEGAIMANYASFRDIIEHTVEQRRDFFKLIFGKAEGYVCIAYKNHVSLKMTETFFEYPSELNKMCASVDANCQQLLHAYFCPNLLSSRKRDYNNVISCPTAWCDLDTCPPSVLQITPSITVQSSGGKFQGYWRFEEAQPPHIAEDVSRRIAYFHKDHGADTGCWNRSRLLRIPYTPNYKYGDLQTAPVVVVINTTTSLFRVSDFAVYPEVQALKFASDPTPTEVDLPDENPLDILQRYSSKINHNVFGLYSNDLSADEDWSSALWSLERLCAEAGLTIEETFAVARSAKCNKYARDRRPESELWAEVKKAYIVDVEEHNLAPTATFKLPEIISDEEIRKIQKRETFVERYIKWAANATDAAVQYHQASAFTILSSVLSSNYKLQTSFGTIIPNLWFMILANTTITRKSTAMDLGMDLLKEIDEDAIMATDGTVEGILTALSRRAKRSSIYYRDEFTGLLDAISNKDYMAGMAELFTKLYDGKSIKRLRSKEEIKVDYPIFVMYAGGIKTKTQFMLTEDHVSSGFIPRFVFITAEPDPSRTRPVGPPVDVNSEEREMLKNELLVLYKHYNEPRLLQGIGVVPPSFDATLTKAAWDRYNKFEDIMIRSAIDSGLDHLTPVYDRLAKSTLKAAMLIAASRTLVSDVKVELDDLLHALYYAKSWHIYASEIVNGIGLSNDERTIEAITKTIHNAGDLGVPRSKLMTMYKLTAKRAELLFTTMEQRRLVRRISTHGEPRYFVQL
jgi:hypothetical protein